MDAAKEIKGLGESEMVDQLQEIEQRAAKATPGPWKIKGSQYDMDAGVMAGDLWMLRFDDDYGTGPAQGLDAKFIAHSRQDVPIYWLGSKRQRNLQQRLTASKTTLAFLRLGG